MKNMLKITIYCLYSFLWIGACKAQTKEDINISEAEVSQILGTLAADEMQGRSSLVPEDINRAAAFIAEEFEKAGLKYFNNSNAYFQSFEYTYNDKEYNLKNVVGIIPGNSKVHEYVIFSAHYDHIGVLSPVGQDSVANGADDDASGVTAVIELAKYFAKKNNNERTLVFAAFTAEELGCIGSGYFSEQIDPKAVVAMINIEMIGKESKFGKNATFITGYQYSDLGKILQKNLIGSDYKIYPDPYPAQQLFFRSDNKSLAQKGVAAHTISSVQIDKDDTYHTVKDETDRLNVGNIVSIIKAIAISSQTIISGEDTPSGVKIK